MNIFEFRIIVKTNVSVPEQDLIDFLIFELSSGSLKPDNVFSDDELEAEIIDVDIF